jgi:hypothetical protein
MSELYKMGQHPDKLRREFDDGRRSYWPGREDRLDSWSPLGWALYYIPMSVKNNPEDFDMVKKDHSGNILSLIRRAKRSYSGNSYCDQLEITGKDAVEYYSKMKFI